MTWTVFKRKMAFSAELTKSSTDLVEWDLHTWMSVSRLKRTSERSLWWMYDHRNSGIRKGGLAGPGLKVVFPFPPPLPPPLATGGLSPAADQVWSLTQSFSVDFSQSRIGVNKCFFYKRTIKGCVSCF